MSARGYLQAQDSVDSIQELNSYKVLPRAPSVRPAIKIKHKVEPDSCKFYA